MIGKIDNKGFLWIERMRPEGPRMERATCPRSLSSCGDSCALFGDPLERAIVSCVDGVELSWDTLGLCNGGLTFETLTDERGVK